MNYLEYIDTIPKIDQSLIDEAYWCINNNKNVYPDDSYQYYKTFNAGEKIKNFAYQYFTVDYSAKIHIVYKGLPIHKDLVRKEAFNYIIDPGGDNVYTCFFDDQKRFKQKFLIEKERWHRIQTDVYHFVMNISHPRIAITISKLN